MGGEIVFMPCQLEADFDCSYWHCVIWKKQKTGGVMLREEDVAVSNVKIDLTRGRHNPLER